MIFLVKKIVAPLLFPFSLVMGFLLIGLVLLWSAKKKIIARRLVTAGVVLLLLLSYAVIPNLCLGLLEQRYPPLLLVQPSEKIRWVVVLGGGHTSDPKLPATGQISEASILRLTEGIRIHRMAPGSKLVVSGGIVFDPKPEAATMAEIAIILGVADKDLVLDTASKDTKDQANNIRQIVGADRFALVTSAVHMPRAMALFRKQGLQPVAAPTDFWVKESQRFNPRYIFPNANGLVKMERVFHELLGLTWAKLRGQI